MKTCSPAPLTTPKLTHHHHQCSTDGDGLVSRAAWGWQSCVLPRPGKRRAGRKGRAGMCWGEGEGQALGWPRNPARHPLAPPDPISRLDPSLCCTVPLGKSSALACTALPCLPLGRKSQKRSWVGEKGKGTVTRERGCANGAAQGRKSGACRERRKPGAGRRRSAQLRREGALIARQP